MRFPFACSEACFSLSKYESQHDVMLAFLPFGGTERHSL